jgi:hypothetical protein
LEEKNAAPAFGTAFLRSVEFSGNPGGWFFR